MDPERQEAIAKRAFDWKAGLYAGLISGAFFLFLSRGMPYISPGIPNLAMGRPVGVEFEGGILFTITVQMAMSILYALVIGAVVFRFNPLPAVFVGGLVGLVLYGLNYLVFRILVGDLYGDEAGVLLVHIVYGLLAAALYKALSVKAPGEV